MKAVILARVSSKRQEEEGLSLDNQLETLRAYAKEKDMEVAEEFVFQESAGHKIRKRFDELIAYVKSQPDIGAILAYRVDRTTRNFRDAVLLDNLRVEEGKELHFVYNRLVLIASSYGRDIQDWDLQVFLAKQYLNRLQEDGATTWLHKVRNGEWATKAPCGYLNIEREDGSAWVEPDPERASLIQKAFEMYSTGNHGTKALSKTLAKMGLTTNTASPKPMYPSYLQKHILRNPFYYGEMEYKGKFYPHKYTPLIQKWLWLKCQSVADAYDNKPDRYNTTIFAFKRLLACSRCGRTLSTYTTKNINYIRCHNCKAVHVKEKTLLEQASKIFSDLTIPPEIVDDLREKLHVYFKDEQTFYEDNVERINGELKKIRKRMATMYEDRLDGRITSDEYDKRVAVCKQQEATFLEELKGHSEADEAFVLSCSYILEVAKRASELFMRSQAEQKNRLLRFVFANASVEGEKLNYKLKNVFAGIVECNKEQNWLLGLGSNQRPWR